MGGIVALRCYPVWTVVAAFVLAASAWGDVEPMVKQTTDGISFITGGIGKDERAELRQQFKDYTLRLEIANKKGEYLYKARISLLDAQGKQLLEIDTEGPWLLVDLPAGQYTAVVTHDNTEKKLKVAIVQGEKRVLIVHF